MKRSSYRRRSRGGFTLIEVLLVMVILVVTVSLVTGTYVNIRKQALRDASKTQIGLFESQLKLYQLNLNEYPSTESGLEALRTAPADLPNPDKWLGPYIDKPVPLDPWGQPYQYEEPGRYNADSFDIWSLGPDGADGTEDDIGNWSEEQL